MIKDLKATRNALIDKEMLSSIADRIGFSHYIEVTNPLTFVSTIFHL